ncbi:hypothetical protein [Bradyrhizobium sp. CCBAU 51753]|uniref:hypothetical protein n=1 Tax=Bradyrhizobium sp. CCBAU 51753 TaxID=1325100 RepID=UPI00188D6E89|nr:hypothetical protein [Bradyrhizobium sp. CCBAU 51753]
MLGYCDTIIDALRPLRADRAEAVSFEYLMLAVCVVLGVIAVFGPGNDVKALPTTAVNATAIANQAGV